MWIQAHLGHLLERQRPADILQGILQHAGSGGSLQTPHEGLQETARQGPNVHSKHWRGVPARLMSFVWLPQCLPWCVHVCCATTLAASNASLSAWPGAAARASPSCSSAAATASGPALRVTCRSHDHTVQATKPAWVEAVRCPVNSPHTCECQARTYLAAGCFWLAQHMQG